MRLAVEARPDPIRALVTGCSSGTGRAIAAELTQRGYHVIATARRTDALTGLDAAERLVLDVADPASIARCLAKAGRIDVLVNNAGFGVRSSVEQIPMESARALFETMYFGPLALIQGTAPGMRERGWGVIANVSSGMAGLVVHPFFSAYAAPKVALEAMSEGLSLELARFGVRVLILQLGNIGTNFRAAMLRQGLDGPYADMSAVVDRWRARAQQTELTTPVSQAARAMADAIEAEDPPLRIPIGADAVESLARRRGQSDEEYRAMILEQVLSPMEGVR